MRPNETLQDGLHRLSQPNGPALAWYDGTHMNILEQDGLYFKDMGRTGTLLPYADWRLPAKERAADLASRLSIEEIAGLMLYSPHQMVPPRAGGPFTGTFDGKEWAESGRAPSALSDQQKRFLAVDHIRHILMMMVQDADTAARWNNELQKEAERLPFAIPVNISSDPRNGAKAARVEFKSAGTDVSKWPEGVGFAACFDPEVVRQFAHDASLEYRAMGITTALGPQIDLCTEPRWLRFMDTLGMDTEGVLRRVRAYCDGMQTTEGSPDGWGRDSVNAMVKHWPGGGTGEGGRDAHYPFGAYAVYPAGNSAEHRRPFTEAAFHLDGPTGCAAAVMPYYTVSWGLDTKYGRNVGNSYNEYLIRDLLREKYGFEGVVCTDWGITGDPNPEIDSFGSRCYNMDGTTEPERMLIAILNGVDQFGGNDDPAPVLAAYRLGCEKLGETAMRQRMEQSAARLLVNIYRCGLFEDPYLDPGGGLRGVPPPRRGGPAPQRHPGQEPQIRPAPEGGSQNLRAHSAHRPKQILLPHRPARPGRGPRDGRNHRPVRHAGRHPGGGRRGHRFCRKPRLQPLFQGGRGKRRQRLPAHHPAVPALHGEYCPGGEHRGRRLPRELYQPQLPRQDQHRLERERPGQHSGMPPPHGHEARHRGGNALQSHDRQRV